MKTLLFFCCSSGIQSGTRFAAWGADQACKIYLQAVCLDNLTFFLVRKCGCWFAFFAAFRLFGVPRWFYHCRIYKPFLCAFVNQYSRLTGRRYSGTMIIYSRFRLFLSCLLCAAGADPGRSARTAEKVCSILDPLYNRPIWLFNGRLDSGWRSYSLICFVVVVGEIRASVIDVWKIPGTGPQVIHSLLQNWSYWLWNEQYFCWLLNIRNIQTQKGPEKPAQKWNGSKITSFLDFHFVYLAYINP